MLLADGEPGLSHDLGLNMSSSEEQGETSMAAQVRYVQRGLLQGLGSDL